MSFQNEELLVSIFGRWPSFHDAEVLRVVLDRSGDDGPTLDVLIHVFEMTDEVDVKGKFVLKNHTEATLRFANLALARLEWFNHQNVLSSLEVSAIDPAQHEGRRIHVEMSSSYGMEAEFECTDAIVASVRRFEPAA